MNIIELISEVARINKSGREGLFVWAISPEYGGIGKARPIGTPEWNVVPGFSNDAEIILALARLKVKYEGLQREGKET